MNFDLFPMGDHAVLIELGKEIKMETHQIIQDITACLDILSFNWLIECVPSFTTVAIFYDPAKIERTQTNRNLPPYDYVCEQINGVLNNLKAGSPSKQRIIDIPVCYGGEYGPDLETVAHLNSMTPAEVIYIHTTGDYTVYMIGFAPGFPYIGGMSKKIAAPRKKSPRIVIPARSVAIGGNQTGIYPIETPGGWQIIGRTPLTLFHPERTPPSLLCPGDKIQFKSISPEEFIEWEKSQNDYNY